MAPDLFLLWAATLLAVSSSAPVIVSLGGTWQAMNANATILTNASVPGEIHMDLLQSGIIGDPYYRFGDNDYAWVALDDWTYTTSFSLNSTVTSKKHVELVFEGLDTVADVSLNGKPILSADNMFRRYIVDVTTQVLTGSNTIMVEFQSAITYAIQQHSASTMYNPPDCPQSVQNGFCYIQYIRKEPCSFSWDWGPAYAPQGIWRDVFIQAYDDVTIRDVSVATQLNQFGEGWDLDVSVYLNSAVDVSGTLSLRLRDLVGSSEDTLAFAESRVSLKAGENKVGIGLGGNSVQQWDPVGYGKANLYPIVVNFTADGGTSTNVSRNIGFRTIELVQEPLPGGTSFYFRVNGVPVFVKGANWIPADSFESRVNYDNLRDQLVSYVESNYNTLRVWGGGIYQHEVFYQLADELGLMVWQEFMFACALYETDDAFLNSVAMEVRDQIRRLQYHPSIILWSGNNENEVSLTDNWYSLPNTTAYYPYYGLLYFNTILSNLSLYDTTRPTAGSSPSNGDETITNPVDKSPNSVWQGDVHYYNYDADCWDVSTFPRPRFASEYGFQSYPSLVTMAAVSDQSQGDWDWNSNFTLHRQHHGDGNDQILNQMSLHFTPAKNSDSALQYKYALWMSQVSSGQCIKSETEHYRRIMSECDANNSGCTMGTLYWQANDIWQGASWSSLEYGGRWKVLQYLAKKFYNPVLVSMYLLNNTGGVYVVNELGTDLQGVLTFTMWSWNSLNSLATWTVNFKQAKRSSGQVAAVDLPTLLSTGKCPDAKQCILTYSISNGTQTWSTNHFYLSSPKDVTNFQSPQLAIGTVTEVQTSSEYAHTFSVSFSSKALAPFVWLETPFQGHFSDNGFLWTSSSDASVLFYTRNSSLIAADLQASLDIWSLYSATH